MVKRELSIAVATAATVVVGVAGCSSGNKASGPSSSSATSSATTSSAPASSSTPAAGGPAQVTVGGQPLNVGGPVVCSTTDGKFSIAIGEVITGVIVGLEPDASVVHNAGLGTVDGVVMSFAEGVPGENASATKNGNTYHITGNASGVDNAGKQVNKPFTVDVTCP
ncbi:MAG: ipoprotein LpqH [Mycobacterium sp.]|jgi:lipoprotein LpqH|nr:ipoprotein LpqH [Mycobacterium sp.]MDT5255195.1 ipoprotein LpqH [Mycobacterium sp.]